MVSVAIQLSPLSGRLIYEIATVGLGLIGIATSYYVVRTIFEDEWREGMMRLVRAFVLLVVMQFAELIQQFRLNIFLSVLLEVAIYTYLVYGILKLRVLINERMEQKGPEGEI
ncbi:MAG: hypothetical protein ABEK01_04845 [Candidatus Nanohaloarchaea archaeon]